MLKSYLVIALRTLRRRKAYAAINIAGLALGIACCLLIGLYVQEELSYDRHHENGAQVYRVNQLVQSEAEEAVWDWGGGGLGEDLVADFPQIEAMVRVHPNPGPVRYEPAEGAPRSFRERGFVFADPSLFSVFTHPFLAGDPATAFAEPLSVVLTASTARKYFGAADPLGQLLNYGGMLDLTVTGVIADLPRTSHLQFDLAAPLEGFKRLYNFPAGADFNSYWWPYVHTYIQVDDPAAVGAMQMAMPAFVSRHRPEGEGNYRPLFEPLFDIHLYTEAGAGGRITQVRIFGLIALSILLLACINFMNLATARAARRAKEVGVRKVVGAHRRQLIGQFLGESLLMAGLALVLALGLVELALPLFSDLAGYPVAVDYAENRAYLLGLVVLLAVTGIVAGAYPALYLSGFHPARVLKGRAGARGGARLRQALVVVQFTVSIALIAGATVAFQQLRFVQEQRLGFDEDQMVALRLGGGLDWPALKQELLAQPWVRSATMTSDRPGMGIGNELPYVVEGGGVAPDLPERVHNQYVGYDYFEDLGIPIVAGRGFDPAFPSDKGYRPEGTQFLHMFDRGWVINEAAARASGWTPEEALGKNIRVFAFENGTYYTDLRGTVVGVAADYHHASFRSAIEPVVFGLADSPYGFMGGWAMVGVAPGNARETLTALEAFWKEHAPGTPYEAEFLDATLQQQYVQEARLGKLIGVFAALGVLIACLGLFGLAAYTAEQRTKEIGVRKVLGASVPGLIGLLSRDFLTLVLVAAVVAVPVAYWAMEQWLTGFAYRIELHPAVFLGVALLAMGTAFATVGWQAYRTARLDPARTLRYE